VPVADRVRKARRSSLLACGHYVQTGHMIARVDGEWICIECALEGRDDGEVASMPDDDAPAEPEPVYDAMIRREEGDADPLVPEPLSISKPVKRGK
jgi:hypothetical protein